MRVLVAILVLAVSSAFGQAPDLGQSTSDEPYLRALSPDQRKDYEALKADWEKQTKRVSPDKVKAFRAKVTLHSQFILGRFGYGTSFTSVLDDRTREALRTYQVKNRLPVSSDVDAITYYALTKDSDAADEQVTMLLKYSLYFEGDFVSADGAWDRMNESESSVQTAHLECYRDRRTCLEADATQARILGFPSLIPQLREYTVTKWDAFELVAEDSTPDCERDQLLINKQENSVAIISTPTYKHEGCKKLLGKPETVTYRLIDGFELYNRRNAAAQAAKRNLYQVSGEAKTLLEDK